MNGFINVLKPPGLTSAAVVGAVKRLTGERRVGHAGTLDPEAAGVLPIMVGRATRLFEYLADKEKTYIAECAFGAATDTQDAQGRVIQTGDSWPDWNQCLSACASLIGEIQQRPSAYSAIKKDGKPLYRLAREGRSVEVPTRTVRIDRIELLRRLPGHGLLMRVDCGRGTYIRTLCHDLGALCGCPAHMRFLLRCKTGSFDLSTAVTLEELEAAASAGTLVEHLLPADYPLERFPAVRVSPAFCRMATNGAAIPLEECEGTAEEDGYARVYLDGAFRGIAQRKGGSLVWKTLLPE